MGDPPLQTAEAALARLGMAADTALPALRALGLWSADGPRTGAWGVVEALGESPNPDHALTALTRLAERRPEAWRQLRASEELVARAAIVAGTSQALADLLVISPPALDVLTGALEPWSVAGARQACAQELPRPHAPNAQPDGRLRSAAQALAGLQRRGLLRVAARDLLGMADTPTVAAELADLAQGVLSAALDAVVDENGPRTRVAVIAMGKLGGRELNYVSDVDVIFVHDGDRAQATKAVERFIRLMDAVTPEGRAYQLDANLRPEGRDGPLVRNLDSYASYYERWARTWEFQALLKARPIAGDAALGRDFVALVQPYLWPDRLDPTAVEDVQRMKLRVEESREVVRAGSRQVKLAPGGLRDIEFAVQLLQLVHGRHDPSLRSPNTLEALAALSEGGYVGEDDAGLFRDAYVFLRTVEHRLQLARLRRTHTLPGNATDRARLARSMGFRDTPERDALGVFDAQLTRMQTHVRRLHEKLFYRPLLSRFAQLGAAEQVALGDGEGGLAEDAARDRLAALGFADPEGALRHLDALASGVSRRARLFRTLLPAVLPTLAAAPDPDGGLAAFRSLADRLGSSPAFLHRLRDNPPVAELLARVLGRSRLVGEWLERQPEVLSVLSDAGELARRLEPDEYRRLSEGLLRRGEEPAGAADALRRLKRREVARIAVRDLSGQADFRDVAVELSGLAEACLEAAVALVQAEDPDAEGVRLAVIGMGKLGGGELGYASDLDVLVVFEPAEARKAALRAATRLLGTLGDITPEGQAFQVDANLRPEGKDGPLARTLESYRSYYERWGQPWELQALTQARAVAGDAALGEAFVDAVEELVFPERAPEERLQAVRRMKARVERDRAGPRLRTGVRKGDRVDVKLGSGGLSDVEWTVQLLLLKHGGLLPGLRRPGTLAALDVCEHEGLLDERDTGWLRDGYLLLSRLRNALYLAGFHRSDQLPPGVREQERVARMLGYAVPGAQAMVEDLSRAMRRVRRVHERCFYDAS